MTLVVITEEKPRNAMKDNKLIDNFIYKNITRVQFNRLVNKKPKEIQRLLFEAYINKSIYRNSFNYYYYRKYFNIMLKINRIRQRIWNFN